MDRESKPLTKMRVAALLGIALTHGLIIVWLLSIKVLTSATSIPAIQVMVVDSPRKSRAAENLSALQMHELKPVLAPMAIPHLDIPAAPPPPQAVASIETSETNVSVVASDRAPSISSSGSGAASNGEGGDFTVAHRVQPIYSDASVRAREQGYVVVGLLIDEHGRVRKTKVVQSSGFSRLDQSAVDALRQWTFKRAADAPRVPTWTTFRYGFHLASSNTLDLSAINLALLSYDPELNEQIRAAAIETAANAPKPHGATALRRLILSIQTAAPTVGRDIAGPTSPMQLLLKLGAVQSIQFVGLESHGLDVDSINQPAIANAKLLQDSQWELYEVTQTGGRSEWLLEVTRGGVIDAAQALLCSPDQNGALACP
jgi:TonB family protein